MKITTVGEITSFQHAQLPDKIAMVASIDDRTWTFRQLDQESCQVAQALKAMKIGSRDRIAYLDKNQPEFFTLVFGASKLNIVTVAINWRLAAPEVEKIIQHSESKILLIGAEYLPLLPKMNVSLEHIIVLGTSDEKAHINYSEWIKSHPTSIENTDASPDETCLQLYTSGTTGLPKGVELKNSNIFASTGNYEPLNFTKESISLTCMPVFHIAGSGWAIAGFIQGAKNIIMKEPDLPEILRVVPAYQVTHTVFIPALLQFLLSIPTIKAADFSSLFAIVYGASTIPEKVLAGAVETFGCNFYGMYGLTETTGGITRLDPEDHDPTGSKAELLRSCGKAVNGHEVKIVDPHNGNLLADGELGEIMIRGPQLMRGYWHDPAATSEAVDNEGWFKSGDAGYMKNGYIFIHDRIKDLIISGAENIYPAEIENVLRTHPAVQDIAVIGVPDETWGEAVKAFVCRADKTITEAALVDYCRERLAHYKCPASIEWMDVLPRNSAGKVLKRDLRKLA